MEKIITTLTTEALFSEDGFKRYLLRKRWDDTKPKLTIIMLAPTSEAAGIELDATTQRVLNNSARLGYGSVSIVNLFAILNDAALKQVEDEDPENIDVIVQQAQDADTIVYAPGVGKAKSKTFQQRQEQVLAALLPFVSKLHCLCDEDGEARLQHPLSPAVRTWYLSPLKMSEFVTLPSAEPDQKKKPRGRPPKNSNTN